MQIFQNHDKYKPKVSISGSKWFQWPGSSKYKCIPWLSVLTVVRQSSFAKHLPEYGVVWGEDTNETVFTGHSWCFKQVEEMHFNTLTHAVQANMHSEWSSHCWTAPSTGGNAPRCTKDTFERWSVRWHTKVIWSACDHVRLEVYGCWRTAYSSSYCPPRNTTHKPQQQSQWIKSCLISTWFTGI